MITLVLDEHGNTLHDCSEAQCAVSWDGFAIRDLPVSELFPDEAKRPPNPQPVQKGNRVPNGADPDAALYTVKGKTAQLRRRDG